MPTLKLPEIVVKSQQFNNCTIRRPKCKNPPWPKPQICAKHLPKTQNLQFEQIKPGLHYINSFGMLSNVNIYWRDYHMQTVLIVMLIIVCISLIAVVLLQSGKSAGLSGAISGGAEQLFGKQKARGMDLVLHRATVILSVLFFLIMLLLTYVG